MSQYLGDISAYALAVSQGYTGTEEEYAELMASYATVGQTAVTAAQTATTKASEAATSATTATTKASEAASSATTATTAAEAAQADADAAALDASQALSAASTATTKATEATTAAATATSAATTATTAKDDAVSAKTAAQTAQTGAETAAASVQSSAAQIATNAEDISQLKSELTQKYSSVDVDIIGSYDGSYTNDVIDHDGARATVYAECEENCEYVVEKTATNRFIVFFTSYPPLNGLEILSYRVIDNTASKITAKAPLGAKYICAYVYNPNTDASIDTRENVIASVSIKKLSAVDAVARARIKAVSEITDMIVGNDIDVTYELGGLSLQGVEQVDLNRIRSIGFIDKKESKTSIIINNPSYQFSVRYYKDGVFSSSDTVWRSTNLSDVFAQDSQCNQIRILVRLSSNADITSSIIDDAIKAISVKNESGVFYIPAEVKQAIYDLFSVSAYARTSGVASNLSVLSDWVGD